MIDIYRIIKDWSLKADTLNELRAVTKQNKNSLASVSVAIKALRLASDVVVTVLWLRMHNFL